MLTFEIRSSKERGFESHPVQIKFFALLNYAQIEMWTTSLFAVREVEDGREGSPGDAKHRKARAQA